MPVTWRRKALWMVLAGTSAFVCLVALLASAIFLPQAERAEVQLMEQNLRRFVSRLEATVQEVQAQGSGYAAWDDTYVFAQTRDPHYIEVNLIPTTLQEAGVDTFAIWNREFELIGARRLDASGGASLPLDDGMAAELSTLVRQLNAPSRGVRSGLVRFSSGELWALSVQPILRSDFAGDPRGTLIAGVQITDEIAATLAAYETFSVRLSQADASSTALQPDAAALRPGVGEYATEIIDHQTLLGRTLISGLDGDPTVVIEARAGRPLYQQQLRSIWTMLAFVGLGTAGVSYAMWRIGERLFLHRIEGLQRLVARLDRSGTAEELTRFAGNDEVSALARITGTMALHLDEARRDAEAGNQAKSRFLATMSHEIRTPLNGVLGFAGLLRETPLTSEQVELVDAIKSGGDILLALINDILDISKLDAGRVELELAPVDLSATIERVRQVLTPQVQAKQLSWETVVAAEVPRMIRSDPFRLQQVLLNLAGNAVKFTSAGGVRIQVCPRVMPAGVGIGLEFQVIDTGIGISAEQRSRLFQPFTQADNSTTRRFGGSGLGLAITARLVRLLGGEIEVSSEPGRGSIFTFTILAEPYVDESPAIASRELPRSVESKGEGDQRLGSLRILVAEDHRVNRRMVDLMLRRLGCVADFAENGTRALAALKAGNYDFCFMDVQMPELDGCEVTRAYRLWEQECGRSHLPVFALTANAMQSDRERCFASGMTGFLSKPVTLDELRNALLSATKPSSSTAAVDKSLKSS